MIKSTLEVTLNKDKNCKIDFTISIYPNWQREIARKSKHRKMIVLVKEEE